MECDDYVACFELGATALIKVSIDNCPLKGVTNTDGRILTISVLKGCTLPRSKVVFDIPTVLVANNPDAGTDWKYYITTAGIKLHSTISFGRNCVQSCLL